MEKYKVDKQGKLKIRDKKKIFKILRLIYDICSAIFILFVFVGLIISSSPRDDHNDSVNRHIPNIQEKYRRNVYTQSNYDYIDTGSLACYVKYIHDNEIANNKTANTWYSISSSTFTSNNIAVHYAPQGASAQVTTFNYYKFNSSHYVNSGTPYPSGTSYILYLYNNSSSSKYSSTLYQFIDDNGNVVSNYFDNYGSSTSYSAGNYLLKVSSADTKWHTLFEYIQGGDSYDEEDLSSAYNDGYSSGYSVGYDEGYSEGYDVGYDDANNNQAPVDSQLIISSDYDFRGLITQEIDSATGLMRVATSSQGLTELYYLDLKGLTFKVEDNVYNEVRIAYMSLDSANTIYDSVNMKYSTMQDYFGNDYVYYRGLVGVYYRYVENGTITKQVTIFNGYGIEFNDDEGTSIKGFNFTTPKWSNGVFRSVIIVNDNGQKQTTPSFSDSFTTYELLKLNGSQLIHIDNNVFNVFSLLTQAFNSVGGILSIAIIPGISIGLLMFIPLIVTIILFIIHMIKK